MIYSACDEKEMEGLTAKQTATVEKIRQGEMRVRRAQEENRRIYAKAGRAKLDVNYSKSEDPEEALSVSGYCQLVNMSMYLCMYQSIYLSIYLSIYPSIYLSIYVSFYLFFSPSIVHIDSLRT
jgi:hypothetical protein